MQSENRSRLQRLVDKIAFPDHYHICDSKSRLKIPLTTSNISTSICVIHLTHQSSIRYIACMQEWYTFQACKPFDTLHACNAFDTLHAWKRF